MYLTWTKEKAICDECGYTFESINVLYFGENRLLSDGGETFLVCQGCLAELHELVLQECRDTDPTDETVEAWKGDPNEG